MLPAITGTTPDDTSPLARHLSGIALAVALLAYYALWGRYLRSGRRLRQLYAPFTAIPVPMATLPVLAFFVAAVWLASWPLAVAAAILAVGHLVTSWSIWRDIR